MAEFIYISAISIFIIMFTCLIAYEVLRWVWYWLPLLKIGHRLKVLVILLPIFGLHILNIWIYGFAYFLIENATFIGSLVGNNHIIGITYNSFVDCLYFSASTYSSLGYGDILPGRDLRMLVGAEVLNGLVMIGWTVSFTYLTMEKFWASGKEPVTKFK